MVLLMDGGPSSRGSQHSTAFWIRRGTLALDMINIRYIPLYPPSELPLPVCWDQL